jgi:hypothetical protein
MIFQNIRLSIIVDGNIFFNVNFVYACLGKATTARNFIFYGFKVMWKKYPGVISSPGVIGLSYTVEYRFDATSKILFCEIELVFLSCFGYATAEAHSPKNLRCKRSYEI